MSEEVEAQLCLQCGSMSWSMFSTNYVAEYHVRQDGHVEFKEDFHDVEYACNECGSSSALLGVKGTPKVFREFIALEPMPRILKALEYLVDGSLEVTDDVDLEDVMENIECFKLRWEMLHKDWESQKAVEDFISKARGIIAKWKLITEP